MTNSAFLPGYIPSDGLRVVGDSARLSELAGKHNGAVVWQGALQSVIEDKGIVDCRGIYHWNAENGKQALMKAVNFCVDALQLKDLPDWKHSRDGLVNFLEPYYAEEPECLAFVFFESCRDSLLNRFQLEDARVQIRQVPAPNLKSSFADVPFVDVCHKPLKIRSARQAEHLLDPKLLDFAAPEGYRLNEVHFSRTTYRRLVTTSEDRFNSDFDTWFLCSQEDRQMLELGEYPSRWTHLRRGSLNIARLMSWILVDPITGMAGNYCFDLDPVTGGILTLRWTRQPLEMLAASDPRFDRWLF
ncbi:MAG: hypothetical protein KDB27_14380, partial [Planctomycetales bacterium]|nr:hypothetical protein [Planctomycetales bacterium]